MAEHRTPRADRMELRCLLTVWPFMYGVQIDDRCRKTSVLAPNPGLETIVCPTGNVPCIETVASRWSLGGGKMTVIGQEIVGAQHLERLVGPYMLHGQYLLPNRTVRGCDTRLLHGALVHRFFLPARPVARRQPFGKRHLAGRLTWMSIWLTSCACTSNSSPDSS